MIVDGYVDWAVQRKGPGQKRYLETPNSQEGFVCHSVEGSLAGAFRELDNEARLASWHFTLDLDGTLYQHYRLNASCWASGSFGANTRYIAMEAVGTAAAPLTAAQEATALRLWRELGFTRRGVDLFEHNEVATKWSPNGGPTACPSHRYDGAFAQLEDEMTPAQLAMLEACYAALCAGDKASIDAWNQNGNSLIAGFTIDQQKLLDHLAHHGGSATLPDHSHYMPDQATETGGVTG